jgi:hypothetical protein
MILKTSAYRLYIMSIFPRHILKNKNVLKTARKILPIFPEPDSPFFEHMWESVSTLVEQVLDRFQDASMEETEEALSLDAHLPLVTAMPLEKLPGVLSIVLLIRSHARFTNGTGRFFADAINRFGLPGHHLNIKFALTTDFYFENMPEKKYGFSHLGVLISSQEEWTALQKNLPKVMEEIRITVRTVYEARKIVSIKKLNEEEKALLMRERLSYLYKRDSKEFELNLFDQIQHWLCKAQAETNREQLLNKIAPFAGKEEKISFDRDMFLEIQALLVVYRDEFIAKRKTVNLARLLCYQYFFKKKLQRDLEREPFKRHIYTKIFNIRNGLESSILGVSIGVNLINRYELLDADHIVAAIRAIDPRLTLVPHSYISDSRQETIRFYYLEMSKEVNSSNCFQRLKTLLAQELGDRIESVNHPLFSPFNEETLLKYVTILSKELNKDDVPQIVISFDRQTQDVFSFHLIVLRYVKAADPSLRQRLEAVCPAYRWVEEQVKRISSPQSESCKEASIIKAVIPKLSFFRKDFSLDLGKARLAISAILSEAIGEFRDYNGGTAEVQNLAFAAFKEGCQESEELHMERFFYGIEPAFMQMVIHTALLKQGYLLFKQVVRKEFTAMKYAFLKAITPHGMTVSIATPFLSSTDDFFQKLFGLSRDFPSFAICSLWVGRIYTCTLFYSCADSAKQQECLNAIQSILKSDGIDRGAAQ